MARELGIDRLLGGTEVAEQSRTSSRARHTSTSRSPDFPPVTRRSSAAAPQDVEAALPSGSWPRAAPARISWPIRATEAEPLELVRAARRGLGAGYLIVAGSITSRERIRAIADAGADAFTIGTAVFDGSYSPRKGSILSQLADVIADCEAA